MPDAAPLSPLAGLARRQDPDRFLCALFAPADRRETLFLLTCFNHELARARTATSTTMTGLIRLQWWRDAVEEAAGGLPPRQHEVAAPLAAALRAGLLEAGDLLAMIDAREAEVEEEMPSRAALLAFLRGAPGGYAVAAGRLLGAPAAAMPALQAAGAAYGMASLLHHLAARAAQGHCLLPLDLLEQHGLTPADILRDPTIPATTAMARALAGEALHLLRQAAPALAAHVPRRAVAAALPARLAARDLRRILARGWDPAQAPRPRGVVDRLDVAWTGWRRG